MNVLVHSYEYTLYIYTNNAGKITLGSDSLFNEWDVSSGMENCIHFFEWRHGEM